MAEVLYSSAQINGAVRKVLAKSGRGRRVVLVAFIGAGADVLLPKPAGMEIYCWPEPSATSAKAVRHLLKQRARLLREQAAHEGLLV